ncbi:MAG: hypothetical protein ACREQ4_09545 [Candidatus Binataceae bacterium]
MTKLEAREIIALFNRAYPTTVMSDGTRDLWESMLTREVDASLGKEAALAIIRSPGAFMPSFGDFLLEVRVRAQRGHGGKNCPYKHSLSRNELALLTISDNACESLEGSRHRPISEVLAEQDRENAEQERLWREQKAIADQRQHKGDGGGS